MIDKFKATLEAKGCRPRENVDFFDISFARRLFGTKMTHKCGEKNGVHHLWNKENDGLNYPKTQGLSCLIF